MTPSYESCRCVAGQKPRTFWRGRSLDLVRRAASQYTYCTYYIILLCIYYVYNMYNIDRTLGLVVKPHLAHRRVCLVFLSDQLQCKAEDFK